VVILTKTTATILISVNMYIPWSLRSRLIINLVAIAPSTEPNGKIPIRIDWAENGSIDMLYYWTIFLMGTDVISLRLYPNMIALNDKINPIKSFLGRFFNRFFATKKLQTGTASPGAGTVPYAAGGCYWAAPNSAWLA